MVLFFMDIFLRMFSLSSHHLITLHSFLCQELCFNGGGGALIIFYFITVIIIIIIIIFLLVLGRRDVGEMRLGAEETA